MSFRRNDLKISQWLLLALLTGLALLTSPAVAEATDLLKATQSIHDFVAQPGALTQENCAVKLQSIAKTIAGYKSTDLKRTELVKDANSVIQSLWESRLLIRERLHEFYLAGSLEPACVKGARVAFRTLRFMEEYAGVHTLEPEAWIDPEPTEVFSGGFPSLLLKPGLSKVSFQSGDVLVSYGMAYGSAAIAHVGEDGGTFSHMALVYIDEKTKITYTIEAHPEFGVKVAPIEKYLADGKGRSALFRYGDAKLARTAAARMFAIASKADYAGHPIPYDFAMDLVNHDKLFCTEIVKYAFELAEKNVGPVPQIPLYPTKISMKNTYVLDAFGIKTRVAFAPSDIEVDPQFTMLAEWRDLARVRLMHHQQAVLEKEFRWLDDLDYTYKSDLESILASRALYLARHLPLFSGLVDGTVPPDLSPKTLEAVANVYLVSDKIHDRLIELDQDQEANGSNQTLMTASEIAAAVEQYRVEDLEDYRAYQRWLTYDRYHGVDAPPSGQFHWMLRGRNEP